MAPRKASDEKAALIIEAARKVLTRQGYTRTTIKEVAAEAGVSRGLLHYYFKSKEEMLFMVVRQSVAASSQLTERTFSQSNSIPEIAANICQALRYFVEESPDLISIIFESWSLARQSQSARDELENVYNLFRLGMCKGLENAIERGVLKPTTPVMQMSTMITAFIDGLSFELMVVSSLRQEQQFWQASQKSLEAMLEAF